MFRKSVLPILTSTVWISLSEFFRNELLLKSNWNTHYEQLGLIFPSEPINGVVWGLWSFCFSLSLFIIRRRFTFYETIALGWFVGFILMWLVVGNMSVLPFDILWFAVPLSILEVFLALWIIDRFAHASQTD